MFTPKLYFLGICFFLVSFVFSSFYFVFLKWLMKKGFSFNNKGSTLKGGLVSFEYDGGFNFYVSKWVNYGYGKSNGFITTLILILLCGVEFIILIMFLGGIGGKMTLFCFSLYTFFIFIGSIKIKD